MIEKKGEANFLDDDGRIDKEKLKQINAEYKEYYPDFLRNGEDKQSEIEDANTRFNSFYYTHNTGSQNGHENNDGINSHTSSLESVSDNYTENNLSKKKKIRFQ